MSDDLHRSYERLLWRLHDTVSISIDADRDRKITGTLSGIDDNGHLILDLGSETRTFAAADVS